MEKCRQTHNSLRDHGRISRTFLGSPCTVSRRCVCAAEKWLLSTGRPAKEHSGLKARVSDPEGKTSFCTRHKSAVCQLVHASRKEP